MVHALVFRLLFIFVFVLAGLFSFGQNTQKLIQEGNVLRAEKKHAAALEKYREAMLSDMGNAQVHYLMASTFFSLKKYAESVQHCDRIVNMFSPYEEEALLLKGRALLLQEKTSEALQVFLQMMKDYPGNYLAHYYVARSYYKMEKFGTAEEHLTVALSIHPNHADSHLLLGNVMSKKDENIKALMAFTNFLLLEPRGERASEVYARLEKLFPKVLGKNNDLSSLSTAMEASINQFPSGTAMISVFDGKIPEGQESYLFSKQAKLLFDYLISIKKESSFWWNFYVNFFNDMNYDQHLETLVYFISQSQHGEDNSTWLVQNQLKVSQMIDWINAYDR